MRYFGVAVSMVVSLLVMAGVARADVNGLRLDPPVVAAGQPTVATIMLSEPAGAAGQEVILWAHGPFTGYTAHSMLVKVAPGATTVSRELVLPSSFGQDERYTVQAYIVGRPAFRNAELTVSRTEPGEYRIVSFSGQSTLRVGRPAEPVVTINRPAPAGGLLVDRQYVGASTPTVRGSERLLVPAGSVRGTTEAYTPEWEFQGGAGEPARVPARRQRRLLVDDDDRRSPAR